MAHSPGEMGRPEVVGVDYPLLLPSWQIEAPGLAFTVHVLGLCQNKAQTLMHLSGQLSQLAIICSDRSKDDICQHHQVSQGQRVSKLFSSWSQSVSPPAEPAEEEWMPQSPSQAAGAGEQKKQARSSCPRNQALLWSKTFWKHGYLTVLLQWKCL